MDDFKEFLQIAKNNFVSAMEVIVTTLVIVGVAALIIWGGMTIIFMSGILCTILGIAFILLFGVLWGSAVYTFLQNY